MPSELEVVQAIVAADVAGWGRLDPATVSIKSGAALTEWHTVLFLEAPAEAAEAAAAAEGQPKAEAGSHIMHQKLVANIPSWRGATLLNKEAASRHLAAQGLAPQVLAELQLADTDAAAGSVAPPLALHVGEFIPGGILTQEDLAEESGMRALGCLYAQLHAGPTAWFTTEVAPALVAEGLLPAEPEAESWAGILWVMPWLQQQVPGESRSSLEAQGVSWEFLEKEITALPR